MVLSSRKEAAIALKEKNDAEKKLGQVVAETDKKLKEMQEEIENDRLQDTQRRLAETDLLKQEVKISQVIAQLRQDETIKL